jgi:hypothetical protein
MHRILILLTALALAGCGGGGGGGSGDGGGSGGGGGGSNDASATGLTVSFSVDALTFSYTEGMTPTPRVVTANVSGTTTADVLVGAEVTGTGIATPIQVEINTTTRSARIVVTPARSLAPGTYTGTITMLACTTSACTQHHGGSPHKVSYVVTVTPALTAAPSAINLAAGENGTSTMNLALGIPPAQTAVVSGITYKSNQTGWLSATINGSTVNVQAAPRSMPPGTYNAELNLKLADGSQQLTVPVVLTVSSGLLVSSGASIEVNNLTTTDQMLGAAIIGQANGSGASSWSATSDQAWLHLDSAGGAFNTALPWHVDLAAFAPLANGVHHQAVLTVRSNNGLTPQTFKVDAFKNLSQLGGLSATALLAGQGGELMLYGHGFDTLSPVANFVSVAGTTPSTVTRVSDQLLRVQMPALPEGSYAVSIKTVSGLTTPAKKLSVTGRATYAYQSFATAGSKTTVVWDSLSKSAFVANRTLNSVMRYGAVNGQFQLITTRSFPLVDTIGMTADHSALVVQSGNTKLIKVSPLDLSTVTTFDLLPQSAGYVSNQMVPATILADNRMYMERFGWVDLDTGAVTALNLGQGYSYMADWGAVSGNGMRMLWSPSGAITPMSPIARLDLSDDKFVQTSASYFYRYAANYDGTRWAYNNAVVDFDMGLKGMLSMPSGWSGNTMAFSRNGSRLYYYATDDNNKARVFVFDTSVPVTTTLDFPILGLIELADTPNCPYNPYATLSSACSRFVTQMTIADDDQTLFIAGDTKFLVVPIPPALGPTSAAATAAGTPAMVRMSRVGH